MQERAFRIALLAWFETGRGARGASCGRSCHAYGAPAQPFRRVAVVCLQVGALQLQQQGHRHQHQHHHQQQQQQRKFRRHQSRLVERLPRLLVHHLQEQQEGQLLKPAPDSDPGQSPYDSPIVTQDIPVVPELLDEGSGVYAPDPLPLLSASICRFRSASSAFKSSNLSRALCRSKKSIGK